MKQPQHDFSEGVYHDIFYTKLLRRFQFQALRENITPHGEWDGTLFFNEDYVLDKCTQEDFDRNMRFQTPLRDNMSDRSSDIIKDWETLKGKAYMEASKRIQEEYYNEDGNLTYQGARTLLRSLKYVEEED